MAWFEGHGIDYISGLAGNSVLNRQVYEAGDALKVLRAEQCADKLRGLTLGCQSLSHTGWKMQRTAARPQEK